MKHLKIILISLLFVGCATKSVNTRFSGDHTTTQIRGMWYICFQTKARNDPTVPPIIHTTACDCIVDKSREKFKSSDYGDFNADNLTMFFKDATIECDAEQIAKPEPVAIPPKTL